MATSITAKSGRSFILKAGDQAISPPIFTTVGGIRSLDMTVNDGLAVDISNVAGNGFQEWLPDGGLKKIEANCQGIYDSLTSGAQLIEAANRTGVLVSINIVSGHGDNIIFDAIVTGFTRSGTHDGAEEYTFTVSSHGNIAY